MTLPDRVRKYINHCEPAIEGQGGSNPTFKVACTLTWGFGLSVEQAWPFMTEYNLRCDPPWNERDLWRKLTQALINPGHTKPRGYLLGENIDYVPPAEPLPKPEPAWPAPDLEAIYEIVSSGPSLYDLWEGSPVRFEDGHSHADEIIDILLPGNPLLCVGKSNEVFATRSREKWRGRLAALPLLVPNPMLSIKGQTQEGRQSEHTKAATAQRIYQVIEFDFNELDKSGKDTIWAPLIRRWRRGGIEIADACASLFFHLREQLDTLACCCHSGGKSLHGWFRVLELSPALRRQFMRKAVSLGADRATFTRSQFVRVPDGQRANGARQTFYYLNPQEAVRA